MPVRTPVAALALIVCTLAPVPPKVPAEQVPGALLLVEREGKFGFFTPEGKPGIAPIFEQARPFSEGLAAVRKGGRWGYIDRNGQAVIDFRFATAGAFREGLAVVAEREREFFFIDRTGKRQFDKTFQSARPFSNGLAAVSLNGQWGYIDRSGSWILPATLDAALECSETSFCVTRDDGAWKTWALTSGEAPRTVHYSLDYFSMTKYGNDLAAVRDRDHANNWHYVDTAGRKQWDLTFADASFFQEGLAPVRLHAASQTWSYIDTSGRVAVQGPYSSAGPFRDGHAVVTDSIFGRRYYINQKGERVLAMSDRPSTSTPLIEVRLRSVPAGAAVYLIPQWDWEHTFKGYADVEAKNTPPAQIRGLSDYLSPSGTTDITEHVVEKVYTIAFYLSGRWRLVRLDVLKNKPNTAAVKFE